MFARCLRHDIRIYSTTTLARTWLNGKRSSISNTNEQDSWIQIYVQQSIVAPNSNNKNNDDGFDQLKKKLCVCSYTIMFDYNVKNSNCCVHVFCFVLTISGLP